MSDLKHQEMMWAEVKVDCYCGDECDQHKNHWWCFADGDDESETGISELRLDVSKFPAGTKVTVTIPICPECGDQREVCECGFDWHEWEAERYS